MNRITVSLTAVLVFLALIVLTACGSAEKSGNSGVHISVLEQKAFENGEKFELTEVAGGYSYTGTDEKNNITYSGSANKNKSLSKIVATANDFSQASYLDNITKTKSILNTSSTDMGKLTLSELGFCATCTSMFSNVYSAVGGNNNITWTEFVNLFCNIVSGETLTVGDWTIVESHTDNSMTITARYQR